MGFRHSIVLLFAVVGTSLAFTAEYVPKSFYVIHPNGERSPTVFLRDKRSLQDLVPLVRMRRSDTGGAGSGSGSYSGSFSGAGSGAGTGGGNDAVYFADNLAAGLAAVMKLAGFPNGVPGFPGGVPGASGYGGAAPGFPAGGAGGYGNGLAAPDLHSRFGGDDGVSYSGSAEGAKGVYSASSSSIDGDGNVKYSVKTGKF